MSNKPTAEVLEEIRDNFDYFDRDNNGRIDITEFTKLLKVIDPSATTEQAEKGFEFIDSDNNGHIDLDEFIDWWQTHWWQY